MNNKIFMIIGLLLLMNTMSVIAEPWWETPVNFSNGSIVNGTGDFFMKYPNFILGNYFALGTILTIWLFLFVGSLMAGSRKAILVASFPTFILSMFWIKFINPIIPFALIVLVVLGLIGSKEEGSY